VEETVARPISDLSERRTSSSDIAAAVDVRVWFQEAVFRRRQPCGDAILQFEVRIEMTPGSDAEFEMIPSRIPRARRSRNGPATIAVQGK
jgi:hypothetical protein